MPVELDAIGVVELPRPMVQALGKAGDDTMGLTPALLSSVAPSGIVRTEAVPVA